MGQRLSYDFDLVGKLGCCLRSSAEKAISMLNRPTKRSGVAAAEPDRRPWLLERLRLHSRVFELPEAPPERDPGFAPQRFHDLQTFIEPREQVAGIYSKRREHSGPASGADARFEAASAELVQCA